MALSLLAATQSGGCGRCTGRQVRLTSLRVQTSLSTVTPSSVQRRLTTSRQDRKSTRLNSSHLGISYAVFCLKKKKMTKSDALQNTDSVRAHLTLCWKSRIV